MESDKSDDLAKIYEKISNSWNSIFDYLDINSLFQSEVASKYFRNLIKSYYKTKNNEIKENSKKENEEENIKLFKKNLLSQYFNLFVHINISDQKFGNDDKSSDNTPNSIEEKLQLEKKYNPKTESIFFKNKIQIKQISIQENKFFILYNNNKFSILDFDILDISNQFNESFSYNFSNNIISKFIYYDNQKEKIIFFIKENSTELFYLYLNKKEKEINILNLKNEFEIFKEDNLIIKNIFTFNEFLLFHINKDEFILVPFTHLKITKENDEKEKKSEENGIIYPKKLENTFGVIKHIYSNNSNVIILNNEDQIYSIPASDYKNYINQIPKFKLFSEQKFPNFYTISGYNNYFILLEKEKVKSLEEWNNDEIYKWFEEMELDDYLNMIKFQKITGKDIVQGGKDYLIDFMGVEEDHLNKLNYEINTLKFESSKNLKLWGWGNNKNGQLGLMNNQTFVKAPTQINLPNLMPDDTIEKIYCDKTYSILLTKFGNIFITGNYSVKDQSNDNQKKNNNNNQSNQGKKNKGKNKHHKDEHKEKGKKNDKNKEKNKDNENIENNYVENRWINVSQNICYSSYNLYKGSKNKNSNSYFKIKDIFCQDNNIFFIGFYSNTIPFYAIQRKPKFKHLKKGGKFITSDKVIEHIQEFSNDKLSTFKIIYGDSLLKKLETTLDAYLESEVPFHKIIQIKDNNEVIWDRKKRYFKEDFINININK